MNQPHLPRPRAPAPRPRAEAPRLEHLVLKRLCAHLTPRLARTVLRRALDIAHLEAIPRDPGALRRFVEGPLTDVARVPLGDFEAVYASARAHDRRSAPATPERFVVLTVDESVVESLRARVRSDATVTGAESLYGLSPLAERGPPVASALVVDVPLTPVPLATLARMLDLLPPGCALWLVGVRDADRGRIATLFDSFGRRDDVLICGSVRELPY